MRIGIDLVAIKRFRNLKKSDYAKWKNVFTSKEWEYAFRDNHPPEHLAGIFAAKEAAMKASGRTGITGFTEFEITHTANGAPVVNRRGYRVSISHDKTHAVGVVLIEK